METDALVRLTRLAQSMPIKGPLRMERCDGPRGEVFMAYGQGDGSIHGAWGYFGLCQAIDFEPGATLAGIRQVLFEKAVENVEQQVEAGVLT